MSIKDRLIRKKEILAKRASRLLMRRVRDKIQEKIDHGYQSPVTIRGELEFVDGRESVTTIGQCYVDENGDIWMLTENSHELIKLTTVNEEQRNSIIELIERHAMEMETMAEQGELN